MDIQQYTGFTQRIGHGNVVIVDHIPSPRQDTPMSANHDIVKHPALPSVLSLLFLRVIVCTTTRDPSVFCDRR